MVELAIFWGDVKKTSPMKGKVFFTGDIHTYRHTDGHRNSITELVQWANSVKRNKNQAKVIKKNAVKINLVSFTFGFH